MPDVFKPFVTFITPTYRRPKALAHNLASVQAQTAADDIEQIVLPDPVGLGVAEGLYGRLPRYAAAVHGQYVNVLCDDDVLASPQAVELLRAFVRTHARPPKVIVVEVTKGGRRLPSCLPEGPPQCGHVDLTSFIVRADIWRQHVDDYGRRYEGDYDHAKALFDAGYGFRFMPQMWAIGGASHGRVEEGAA